MSNLGCKNLTSPIVIPGSTTISKAIVMAFKNMAIYEWEYLQVRNKKSSTPSISRGDSIVIALYNSNARRLT